ncbi:type III secretion system HrpP C-terminal domain-containing protein [Pseudomonas costantinii]|nr:type III secretion system HrpP C-terminal domain-containing protein [Pseudomonas costantinii]NVZ19379.1 flagellar hook-length control protein FliK [Pseudomonas costantinii]OIN49343.1 type III secretion protein [Pseudomonas costantinii]
MNQVSNSSPERSRPREPKEEREPMTGGVVLWEQGRLFASLFADEGEESGYGASSLGNKALANVAMIDALAEQLAPRIQGASQWPLQAVLYVPRLGRISASVRREQGAWNIELDAEEDATARWLSGVRQQCQERFMETLGQPVNLHLPDGRPL